MRYKLEALAVRTRHAEQSEIARRAAEIDAGAIVLLMLIADFDSNRAIRFTEDKSKRANAMRPAQNNAEFALECCGKK